MFDDVVFAASDTRLLKQKKDGRWFEQMQPTPAISYRKEYHTHFISNPERTRAKEGVSLCLSGLVTFRFYYTP